MFWTFQVFVQSRSLEVSLYVLTPSDPPRLIAPPSQRCDVFTIACSTTTWSAGRGAQFGTIFKAFRPQKRNATFAKMYFYNSDTYISDTKNIRSNRTLKILLVHLTCSFILAHHYFLSNKAASSSFIEVTVGFTLKRLFAFCCNYVDSF